LVGYPLEEEHDKNKNKKIKNKSSQCKQHML